MKNRWLLNLALGIVVVALAVFAWWRPGQPPPKPALTALAPAQIGRVVLERDGERIVLTRHNGNWQLEEPLRARASNFNVESMLRIATAASETRITEARDLAQYGLQPPRARVQLDGEELLIGNLHPINNQMYLQHRGTVHLISAHYQGPVHYRYTQFLDSRLFESDFKPTAFRLPGFRLIRTEQGWRREPAIAELSSDRINDFVQEWRNASALSVSRATRAPVLATIEIDLEHDQRREQRRLGIVAREPQLVLRREDEGLEYHFPAETGARLLTLLPAKSGNNAGR